MLDEKFIYAIKDLAEKACNIEYFEIGKLRKVAIRNGEKLELYDIPPDLRSGVVYGFEDFVASSLDAGMTKNAEIYHSEDSLILLLDRNDRKERVLLPLAKSEKFESLQVMDDEDKPYSSKELIRKLRFEFNGTGVEHLIAGLRKVDFARKSDGSSRVEHGRESLGRSVEAAIQQIDAVPEDFRIRMPVYVTPGLRDLSMVEVQCGVYIDVERECFRIKPLADEIDSAIRTAQISIGKALRERLPGLPIYYGII